MTEKIDHAGIEKRAVELLRGYAKNLRDIDFSGLTAVKNVPSVTLWHTDGVAENLEVIAEYIDTLLSENSDLRDKLKAAAESLAHQLLCQRCVTCTEEIEQVLDAIKEKP